VGEVGVRESRPNIAARGFGRLGEMIGDSPGGQKFSDAWWSIMNNPKSPVAMVRKTLGIRNPYQKLLTNTKMDSVSIHDRIRKDYQVSAQGALDELGPELHDKAMRAWAIGESVEKVTDKATYTELSTSSLLRGMAGDQDVFLDSLRKMNIPPAQIKQLQALKLTPEEVEKIMPFMDNIKDMFDRMLEEIKPLIERGVWKQDEMGEWINYLPKARNVPSVGQRRPGRATGTASPGFMEKTTYTMDASTKQAMALSKPFLNDMAEAAAKSSGQSVDDVLREIVTTQGLTPVSTNLEEILGKRINAHARAMGRGHLIEQFREFGVPIEQLQELGRFGNTAMKRAGIPYSELSESADPAMKGYLFDKDVKDIMDKTYAMVASDDAMQGWKRAFMNMTQWWKGMVTATPGFHLRNFFSNNVTGLFRHGLKWMDPRMIRDSTVATVYALNPGNYVDILTKQFKNLDAGGITAALNRKVGGKTLKDIAEEMRDAGVISTRTYISDVAQEITPKVSLRKRMNPFSRDFAVTSGSRQLGEIVENSARAHAYMLTYDDLIKMGTGEAAAKEFAKIDTKKWWIDYGDLSEAEQKYLKNVIPFYTWMRKNLANQVSGLMLMPDMYRLAAKAEEAVSMDDFDYSLVPEYMKEGGYLPIGEGEKGPTMWWPNLPYGDLNKIPVMFGEDGIVPELTSGKLLEEFASSANPIIKTIIQGMTQKNMFKQRDYIEDARAPQLFQFFANSPKVLEVLDGMMQRRGFEGGIGIDERDGKVVMDEEMEQILTNNMPVLKLIGQWVDLAIDVSGLEEAVQEKTGRMDKHEGLEDLLQKLSYFGGFKLKELDQEQELEYMKRAIEEAAQKDRNKWKRSVPGYAQRSARYGQQQDVRRRRIGL